MKIYATLALAALALSPLPSAAHTAGPAALGDKAQAHFGSPYYAAHRAELLDG